MDAAPRADRGAQGDTSPGEGAPTVAAARDGAAISTSESSPLAAVDAKPVVDGKPDADEPAVERSAEKKRGKEKPGAAASRAGTSPSARTSPGDKNDDNALLPPSDGSLPLGPTDPSKEASVDCNLPDKDMAREAWRRNWPALCSIAPGGKASLLIPVKGSLDGEVHEIRRRPSREARIVLPRDSELRLTLKQYKMNRLGFKDLRITKTDDGRIRLRLKLLPGGGDPTFEVKDGYVKITIAAPGPS
jgi:hypothetical protein